MSSSLRSPLSYSPIAEFFTDGNSLDIGGTRSVFDTDGFAIVIYEKRDDYEEEESEAVERIARGVIRRS